MHRVIDRLLENCSGAGSEYFEASDWLYDADREQLETVLREYFAHYQRRLNEMIKILGEPDFSERTNRSEIDRWYPEAVHAACWVRDGKTLCLALEHHDKETPVLVLLRCLSADEIANLSA